MPTRYSPARQVERIAQEIIRDHHPHLIANAVHILYLFTDEAEKVKGKRVLGTARKVSGLNAYLARRDDECDGPPNFFLICVWQQWWESPSTTDAQRRALVDHECCHLWSEAEETDSGEPTGKVKLSVLPHDITEFNAIAARHGAWQPDIEDFLAALRGDDEDEAQPRLLDIKGKRDEELTSLTITHAGQTLSLSPDELRETRDRLHRQAGGGS